MVKIKPNISANNTLLFNNVNIARSLSCSKRRITIYIVLLVALRNIFPNHEEEHVKNKTCVFGLSNKLNINRQENL